MLFVKCNVEFIVEIVWGERLVKLWFWIYLVGDILIFLRWFCLWLLMLLKKWVVFLLCKNWLDCNYDVKVGKFWENVCEIGEK